MTWLLERARRVWRVSDAMVEMTGGKGRLRLNEAVMVCRGVVDRRNERPNRSVVCRQSGGRGLGLRWGATAGSWEERQ